MSVIGQSNPSCRHFVLKMTAYSQLVKRFCVLSNDRTAFFCSGCRLNIRSPIDVFISFATFREHFTSSGGILTHMKMKKEANNIV